MLFEKTSRESNALSNLTAMPSQEHETLIHLFRNRPSLAAELLVDALGVTIPTYSEARLESEEFTDCTPTEYRADAVVMLTLADEPALAVVVEVQRGQDKDKRPGQGQKVELAGLSGHPPRPDALPDRIAGDLHQHPDRHMVCNPDPPGTSRLDTRSARHRPRGRADGDRRQGSRPCP
ncbi:hypothetical protein [Streptosporangium roseum]|uniref:hypothetical protein n=1 Tax=Streptosporangium roseum TaxID=2001 RepID=UPI001C54DFEA|nr:hypothetical protein [Streptosporangium roseum]